MFGSLVKDLEGRKEEEKLPGIEKVRDLGRGPTVGSVDDSNNNL